MKFNCKLLLPIIILVAGCSTHQPDSQPVDESPDLVKVVTIEAQERMHSPSLTFSGTIFANREANLGASLPGKVEKIFFSEGQFVPEGSLVVELSDEMLTQAQIEYETLKKDFERVERLREKGSISEMEYDHVKAQFDASKVKTEMVRKNTQIYAPFSGVLVEKMMEEGEVYFLNPGLDPGYSMRSGVVRLMQLDPVKVKFEVNEKELPQIAIGQKAVIQPDALGNVEYQGKVSAIKAILSTVSRSATAEILIANPKGMLKPGMFARVTVSLPEQKMTFIPISCILRVPGTGSEYVFTVRNNKVSRTPIERTTTVNDLAAVRGIAPNELIVIEGKTKISDGQTVEVAK